MRDKVHDRRITLRPVAIWIASGIAVIAVVVTTVLRAASDPLACLQTNGRLLEARLSFLEYGPYRPGQRIADPCSYSAVADLQKVAERKRTPENLHRLAVGQLALGKLDQGHDLLAEVSRARPNDAAILSDLAAAELARGRIADAAELAARALELDPTRQAAAFNWALALEQLSNRPAAIRAWERYLLLESESGWAAEASEHLSRLRTRGPSWQKDQLLLAPGADAATIQRVVAKYPQQARSRIQDELLPQWVETGDPRLLSLLRSVAAVRAASDPFLRDVIEHAATHREAMLPAVRAWKAACAANDQGDYKAVSKHFAESAAILDRAGSPLALCASLYAASADGSRGGGVSAVVAAVRERLAATGDRYPAVSAEAAWVLGVALTNRGDPDVCLATLRSALDDAIRSGETENLAGLRQLIATELENVSDPVEAETYRLEALRQSDGIGANDERMYVAFAETAISAMRAGRPRVALAFLESATELARRTTKPLSLAESDAFHAQALVDLGRKADVEALLDSARLQAVQITDEGFRERTLANIAYTAGRLATLQRRPAAAIASYGTAIDIWKTKQWAQHQAAGYLGRAEAALSTGDRASAEGDLRAGIEALETTRDNVGEPAMRVAYFEGSAPLFERLIALLLDEGRPTEALSITERKRGRMLLDQITAPATGRATPLDADGIASLVSGRTAILEIALLDSGPQLWLVHDRRIEHAGGTATEAEIEAAAARHVAAIAADDVAAIHREGRWLYDQLIAPLSAALPAGADLVIVPDGVLQAFPFATLVAPDGAYLIQKYTLATAPSANLFLRRPARAEGDELLAVAQPAPSGFDRLPSAAAEVGAIARGYRRGRVLTGDEVAPAGFLDLAGDAAFVHFSGHARIDQVRPARSALLFETAAGPPAELTVKAIGRSRLRAHPLVVLAACSTGRGKPRRTEGIDSLAAAFLQAGARGVVTTLWDVEDTESAALFRIFHEKLRSGARAADALRDAQRSLIQSTSPNESRPAAWGSAAVFGTL